MKYLMIGRHPSKYFGCIAFRYYTPIRYIVGYEMIGQPFKQYFET